MRYYGSTIGEALGAKPTLTGASFDPDRLAIFKNLVYDRMIHPDYADNIKVFIKPEAHKIEKIVDGRFRLISAVSLVDTMVDRILYRRLANSALQAVGRTPIMLGWAPIRGGYKVMFDKFRGMKTRGLDKTAWDWTVSGWLLEAIKEVLKELLLLRSPAFDSLMESRWGHLFKTAHFEFSDGTVVAQPGYGVMKSGCYLTIMINSLGQLIYHALALQELRLPLDHVKFVVIGDDLTLEDFPEFPAYEEIVRKYGAKLKPSKPTEHIEFAGFCYVREAGREICFPEYWRKHVFALTHTPVDVSRLQAYQIIYANEPAMYSWIERLMSEECPGSMRTKFGCRAIWEMESDAPVSFRT